jgi:xanthine dehydrogenase YagS FAD-binding subunit
MQAFTLVPGTDEAAAGHAASAEGAAFIAGGTDLMQLMKANVIAPRTLVDLSHVGTAHIAREGDTLRFDARATMSAVAAHQDVRTNAPVISEALLLSASPQVRNMGTIGGNVLQRTRCLYFRDAGSPCNKRLPGSGCPAIGGDNRDHAVFGGSAHCIATHPSDLAVALAALDASVQLRAPDGTERRVPLTAFYRLPGDTPHIETILTPGEMITSVTVQTGASTRRSTYLKVRDRSSFAFALVSAAVALETEGGVIHSARIALGGVAPHPWRPAGAEAALAGVHADDRDAIAHAVAAAAAGATPASQNGFKVTLLQRVVARAVETAGALSI